MSPHQPRQPSVARTSPTDQHAYAQVHPSHRATLYLRVSTSDGRQTTAKQAPDLERLAAARGFEVIRYEEQESAVRTRPVLGRLLNDGRAGQVQAVVLWALDRLHRSMHGAITTVLELGRHGVQVISLKEPWLDTSGPARSLLVAIFCWVAEQERTRLIERTKAGLDRARAQAKRLGRQPASPVLLRSAVDLLISGMSVSEAARIKGVHQTQCAGSWQNSPRRRRTPH